MAARDALSRVGALFAMCSRPRVNEVEVRIVRATPELPRALDRS